VHWLPLPVQAAPLAFLPSQRPPVQKPLTHWESLPQFSRHLLPLQPLKGAQETALGAVQRPFWQVLGPVSLFAPELQLPALH
jgi:hypothetical protein